MSTIVIVISNLCSCYCAFQIGRNFEKSKTPNNWVINTPNVVRIHNDIPVAQIVNNSEMDRSTTTLELTQAQLINSTGRVTRISSPRHNIPRILPP